MYLTIRQLMVAGSNSGGSLFLLILMGLNASSLLTINQISDNLSVNFAIVAMDIDN